MNKSENLIGAKRIPALSRDEKAFIKNALHTEAVLTGDESMEMSILHKLGLQSRKQECLP